MSAQQPILHERDLLVLVKLLAMLGTENPHERAAAGAKVHAWVTQRGLEWGKLLIPEEPPEVEVSVSVGGARATRPASASAYASGPYTQASPFSSGPGVGGGAQAPFATAQAAYAAQQARAAHSASQGAAQGHPWANGPAWGKLVEDMLANHADKLKGDREVTFLSDQLARAKAYGSTVRISEKQLAWLRDILGRAGLTW